MIDYSTQTKCSNYDTKIADHRVSIAVLGIDFCPVGHQQVDDFTVAIPSCQHQRGHLRPERWRESKEEMMIKRNRWQGKEEKTKSRREGMREMVRRFNKQRVASRRSEGQDERRPEDTKKYTRENNKRHLTGLRMKVQYGH